MFHSTVMGLVVMSAYCSMEINVSLVFGIIAQVVELQSTNQRVIVIIVIRQSALILLVIILYLMKESAVRIVTIVIAKSVTMSWSAQLLIVAIVASLGKAHA